MRRVPVPFWTLIGRGLQNTDGIRIYVRRREDGWKECGMRLEGIATTKARVRRFPYHGVRSRSVYSIRW